MKPLTLLILLFLYSNVGNSQKIPDLLINMGRSLSQKEFNQALKGISKPTTFSIDKTMFNFFSVGTYLAHKKLQSNQGTQMVGTDTSVGLRGHILVMPKQKTQLYVGGILGFQLVRLQEDFLASNSEANLNRRQARGIAIIQIGARYFPKTWFGYFIEIGLGNEPVHLGVSIKL